MLRGHTVIGPDCRLAGTAYLDNVKVGARAHLGFGCVGHGGTVAAGTIVAPFGRIARTRPKKKATTPTKPRATKAARRKH